MKTALLYLTLIGLTLMGLSAQAEQFTRVGNHEIHYSAVSTQFLNQETAQTLAIQRHPALGLVNVSVIKIDEGGQRHAKNASITGSVGTLNGMDQSSLGFRNVRDGNATYQIATFRLRDDQTMRFDLDVRYDRNEAPREVSFTQRFYIER